MNRVFPLNWDFDERSNRRLRARDSSYSRIYCTRSLDDGFVVKPCISMNRTKVKFRFALPTVDLLLQMAQKSLLKVRYQHSLSETGAYRYGGRTVKAPVTVMG